MKLIYQLAIKAGLAATVITLASCASETSVSQSKVRSGLDKYNNGYEMEKGEHGMMQAGSDRISHYDSRSTHMGARDFSGKDYNKESYRRKRWGGDTRYTAQQYAGNTDGSRFQHSPHYVNRNARAGAHGKYAAANNSQFNTGRFAVRNNRANEGNASAVRTGSSGYVTSKSNMKQPLIMSKEDYNQLSIGQTKAMLGRQ